MIEVFMFRRKMLETLQIKQNIMVMVEYLLKKAEKK
jgi:hypothetical protein